MTTKERFGNRLLIAEYMGLYSSIKVPPSGSWQTARKRHFAAWLFAGWGAFWLTAAVAACCDGLIASAQAGHESAAIEYRVQLPAGDEQHELPCPDLSHAQLVTSSSPVASFDTPSKVISPPSPAALHLVSAVARVKLRIDELRPPVPFYQRTARLLI